MLIAYCKHWWRPCRRGPVGSPVSQADMLVQHRLCKRSAWQHKRAITLVVWPKHVFAFLADKFQLLTGSKHTGAAAFTSLLYEHQVLKTGRPLAPLPAILQKSSRGIGVKADWLDSIQQTYSLYLACIKPKSSHAVPGKLSWQVQCLICCCSCQFLVLSYHCWRFDTLCFGHMTQS